MAKFQYTYQKIVDLKSSEKTQAEWLLSTAVGKLQAEEKSLEQLVMERNLWLDKLQEVSRKIVPLAELRVMQLYVEYLEISIARKHSDVAHAKREVDRSRTHLTDKMKDEKVWQKSKEKAMERFRAVVLAKEQNELDEMATVRYIVPTP